MAFFKLSTNRAKFRYFNKLIAQTIIVVINGFFLHELMVNPFRIQQQQGQATRVQRFQGGG
jgi:hypothetical protein